MPTTWKPWQTVNNIIYVINSSSVTSTVTPSVSTVTATTTTTLQRVQILDAYFPPEYTPANAYWLRSLINNTIIPWNNAGDLLSNFELAGGAESNLLGAAGGLTYIAGQQYFQSKIWGLGYDKQDLNAPQMGYCIGDRFKQQVFVQFDVINTVVYVEQLQLPRI